MHASLVILAFLLSRTALTAPTPGSSKSVKRDTYKVPAVSGWVTSWGKKLHRDLYSKYDEISFLPAIVDSSGQAVWSIDGSVVETAMEPSDITAADRPTLLSIGGWSGSGYISTAVSTDEKRKVLATSIVNLVIEHKFAGVDLDWEFPNAKPASAIDVPGDKGNTCYAYDVADSKNLLEFIKTLRATLKAKMGDVEPILAAAVPFSGFIGEDNKPLTDASEFVADGMLDYVSIMNYEHAHHYRHDTGIHAPLRIGNAVPEDQAWSIERSVAYWTGAKVPSSKIQIGLAAYGKIFNTALTPGEPLKPRAECGGSLVYQPTNFLRDAIALEDPAQRGTIDPSRYAPDTSCPDTLRLTIPDAEIPTYNVLVTTGVVGADGESDGSTGFKYFWDETTTSPYMFNEKTAQFVTFDNPRSFTEKAHWARKNKLGGVKIFSIQGDTVDGALVTAARKGWDQQVSA